MSNSATCPRCCRVVSLPADAMAEPSDVWVRCPLCHSEFRLQEALDFVPPALEIISPPQPHLPAQSDVPQHEQQPHTLPQSQSPLEEEAFVALADDDSGFVDDGQDSIGIGITPHIHTPTPQTGRPIGDQHIPDLLINPENESFAAAEQRAAPPHPAFVPSETAVFRADTSDDDDLKLSPETPAAPAVPMPTRTSGVRTPQAAGTSAGGMAGPGVGSPSDEPWNTQPGAQQMFFPPLPPKRARSFRRARRRNPVFELLLIIVGGVVGSAIAFGVLLWGFKVDPFDLAKYLPQSMVPEQLQKPETPDGGSEIAHGKGISIIRHPPAEDASREPTAPLTAPERNEALPPAAPPSNSSVTPTSSTMAPPNSSAASTSPTMAARPAPHMELPPLAEPPPEQQPEADGPKSDTAYTLLDVSQATSAASQAESALSAARADNPAADSAAARESRKQYYIALAKLAEIVTLLANQNDDRQIARSNAAAFVLHATDDRTKLEELGTLASLWMDAPGRANKGIALAGTVQSVEPVGKQFRTTVKLLGSDKVVPIMSTEQPEISVGDTALVLGILVPDPRHSLPQYAGKDELLVWGPVIAKATTQAEGTSP